LSFLFFICKFYSKKLGSICLLLLLFYRLFY
jgi:hypothetical protein